MANDNEFSFGNLGKDYDDRKVYCTGGNLNAICNDFANYDFSC